MIRSITIPGSRPRIGLSEMVQPLELKIGAGLSIAESDGSRKTSLINYIAWFAHYKTPADRAVSQQAIPDLRRIREPADRSIFS
jgi:hypothetical protein